MFDLADSATVFRDGKWVADFERSKFNRAVQAHRQTGSIFKAIVYSAAVESLGWSPDTLVKMDLLVNGDFISVASEAGRRGLPNEALDLAHRLHALATFLKAEGRGLSTEARLAVEGAIEEVDSGFGRLAVVRHAVCLDGVRVGWQLPSMKPGTHQPRWPGASA